MPNRYAKNATATEIVSAMLALIASALTFLFVYLPVVVVGFVLVIFNIALQLAIPVCTLCCLAAAAYYLATGQFPLS